MQGALPSITTVYRMYDNFNKIDEGQIQLGSLRTFLLKRNYPLKIFISEDQTTIVKKVRYNPNNNQMDGFVCDVSELTGFPLLQQHPVNSVNDIEKACENSKMSCYAYVFRRNHWTIVPQNFV